MPTQGKQAVRKMRADVLGRAEMRGPAAPEREVKGQPTRGQSVHVEVWVRSALSTHSCRVSSPSSDIHLWHRCLGQQGPLYCEVERSLDITWRRWNPDTNHLRCMTMQQDGRAQLEWTLQMLTLNSFILCHHVLKVWASSNSRKCSWNSRLSWLLNSPSLGCVFSHSQLNRSLSLLDFLVSI